MRFRRTLVAAVVLILVACSRGALGQSRPATTTATTSGVALEATITGVQGQVQVRLSESEPWQLARTGMALGEGAEFRTGPRSAVRFTIPPAQTITLDRLGVVKLLEAVRTAEKVRTNVGMRYGRVHYDIQAAGQNYDASIHSPGSALAIRGTQVILTDTAPFPPTAVSLTGRAQFHHDGRTTSLGGRDGKSTIESGVSSPAETAEQNALVDPGLALARTEGELQALLMTQATVGINSSVAQVLPESHTSVLTTPFSVPPPPRLPGNLVFQLVWVPTSSSAGKIDLDLDVLSPVGELLCPKGCPPRVPSGGRSPTDDVSPAASKGGKLPSGQERASWPDGWFAGKYLVGIQHVSGDMAQYQVVVFRNGRPVRSQSGRLDTANNQASLRVDLQKKK